MDLWDGLSRLVATPSRTKGYTTIIIYLQGAHYRDIHTEVTVKCFQDIFMGMRLFGVAGALQAVI